MKLQGQKTVKREKASVQHFPPLTHCSSLPNQMQRTLLRAVWRELRVDLDVEVSASSSDWGEGAMRGVQQKINLKRGGDQ